MGDEQPEPTSAMSDQPSSRNFASAMQPPLDGYSEGAPTHNFQGSLARNRNRRTDIPIKPPPYICRTVSGTIDFSAWCSFTWRMGDLATTSPTNQQDLRRKYWNKTVVGDNTMHEIYVPPGYVPGSSEHLDIPIPFTNTYNFDPSTNIPSCTQFLPLRWEFAPSFETDIWTRFDQGNAAQEGAWAPPSYSNNWFPNYVQSGPLPHYTTDITVDTWHFYLLGTLPPLTLAADAMITLSNEVDFTTMNTPMYNAIKSTAFPLWGQGINLYTTRFNSPAGVVPPTVGSIEGQSLSAQDFSGFSGDIKTGYGGAGGPVASIWGNYSAPLDGSDVFVGDGTFFGSKTEVLFLEKMSYRIVQSEWWSNGYKNATDLSTGIATPGQTVLLDIPAFFAPTWDLDGPGDGTGGYRLGTWVQLIATPV